MNLEDFELACRSLYGPQWRKPAAKLLGVSTKTIQRWVNGEYLIPYDVADRLACEVERKTLMLDMVLNRLKPLA